MTESLTRQAATLIDLNRPGEALALAGRALATNPEDPEALCVLARAHLGGADPSAAATAAMRAVAAAPEHEYPYRLLACALLDLGDHGQAEDVAARAVSMAPEEPLPRIVHAHALLGVRRPRDAIAEAEHAVRLAPELAQAHLTLGITLFQDGRYTAAEQALRAGLAIDPTDAELMSALAATLQRRGRRAEAIGLLERAARADARSETWQLDLLRYVRGAAGGFATWPVIAFLAGLGLLAALPLGSDGPQLAAVVTYLALAGVLLFFRYRRLARLSPDARAWVARRTRRRDVWGRLDGPRGYRPWWWLLLLRVPLSVRAVALTALALAFVLARFDASAERDAFAWAVSLAVCAGALALWVRLVRRWRRARRPHPLYPPLPASAGR